MAWSTIAGGGWLANGIATMSTTVAKTMCGTAGAAAALTAKMVTAAALLMARAAMEIKGGE